MIRRALLLLVSLLRRYFHGELAAVVRLGARSSFKEDRA